MQIIKKAIGLIFPKVCLNCSCIISENEDLCYECYKQIDFLAQDYCNLCGCIIVNDTSLCGKCIVDPPPFSTLKSVFAYNVNSKNMIISLKFFDNINYVRTYARWMYERNKDIFIDTELIIPVPIHRLRLFQRKYNQAALLAKAISHLSNIPCQLFTIKRLRNTRAQAGLSIKQRTENVKGVFAIAENDLIKNKTILLVDDVVTTGATVKQCAQVLVNCGAAEIKVLTLARTITR